MKSLDRGVRKHTQNSPILTKNDPFLNKIKNLYKNKAFLNMPLKTDFKNI